MNNKNNTTIIILKYVGYVVAAIVLIFAIHTYGKLNNKHKLLLQEYAAATDSLRSVETKYGVLSMKYSGVLDKNDSILDKYGSYTGDIVMVDAVDIVYTDSFNLGWDLGVVDSTVTLNFSYEDSIRSMIGLTSFVVQGCDSFSIRDVQSVVLSDSIKFDIQGGYGQNDGLYERFYLIDDDRFVVNDINSRISSDIILDDKDDFRRLSLGIYCGVGVGYDVVSRRVGIGPQLGVGLSYRIF